MGSDRTNRWGCRPREDVCLAHDEPLRCPHGCSEVRHHHCKFIEDSRDAALKGDDDAV